MQTGIDLTVLELFSKEDLTKMSFSLSAKLVEVAEAFPKDLQLKLNAAKVFF